MGSREAPFEVDGRVIEAAERFGVRVDVLLTAFDAKDCRRFAKQVPHGVERCARCAAGPLECVFGTPPEVAWVAETTYDAVYTRTDVLESMQVVQRLQLRDGAAPLFTPDAPVLTDALFTTKDAVTHRMWAAAPPDERRPFVEVASRDCTLTPDQLARIRYPAALKHRFGISMSGGRGGSCFKHMLLARSEAELLRKLQFFCLDGPRKYSQMGPGEEAENQAVVVVPYYFGAELNVDVLVYRGEITSTMFRWAKIYGTKTGKTVFSTPAVLPNNLIADPSAIDSDAEANLSPLNRLLLDNCNRTIERAVRATRLWNGVFGVQLMASWHDGACALVEVNHRPFCNPRQADLAWIAAHHHQWFDPGVAALFLAFGLDPRPLVSTTARAAMTATLSSCPADLKSFGHSAADTAALWRWRARGKCEDVFHRATAQELLALPFLQQDLWRTMHDHDELDVSFDLQRLCVDYANDAGSRDYFANAKSPNNRVEL